MTTSDATPATLIDLCEQYLRNRHVVLWGTAHEVLTTDGRKAAAVWFAAQLEQLMAESGMKLVPRQPDRIPCGPIHMEYNSPQISSEGVNAGPCGSALRV